MEKYFVIKDVDGMCFIQKSFNDETKANCFAELLADGNENNYIKYYVAKVTTTK